MDMSRPFDKGPAMGEGEERKRRCLDDHRMAGFQGLSGRLQRRERKSPGEFGQ